jgi:hypothetical protein
VRHVTKPEIIDHKKEVVLVDKVTMDMFTGETCYKYRDHWSQEGGSPAGQGHWGHVHRWDMWLSKRSLITRRRWSWRTRLLGTCSHVTKPEIIFEKKEMVMVLSRVQVHMWLNLYWCRRC